MLRALVRPGLRVQVAVETGAVPRVPVLIGIERERDAVGRPPEDGLDRVAGGDVRLSPAAVVHGNLTITVKETPVASQPVAPFGTGDTKVLPRSDVKVDDAKKDVTYMKAAPTLADVAGALGALGLSPRELAGVLQALRAANALEAELVVQ